MEKKPGLDVVGVVLAGGESRRLGRDKCLVQVNREYLPVRMAKLIKGFCPRVLFIGRSAREFGLDIDWSPDDYPGIGPLGGILTALRLAGNRPCLVLACDLPFLGPGCLNLLIKERKQRPASAVMTTFLQVETGYIEALVSIYEPGALSFLYPGLKQGVYKLSRLIPESFRHHIPYSVERSTCFFNVNHPDDLKHL